MKFNWPGISFEGVDEGINFDFIEVPLWVDVLEKDSAESCIDAIAALKVFVVHYFLGDFDTKWARAEAIFPIDVISEFAVDDTAVGLAGSSVEDVLLDVEACFVEESLDQFLIIVQRTELGLLDVEVSPLCAE